MLEFAVHSCREREMCRPPPAFEAQFSLQFTKSQFLLLPHNPLLVSAHPATWMQSALMRADMFIKLGLVSGCGEYCRRQTRPCGAGGARVGDERRDQELECVEVELERPSGGWSGSYPAELCFSPLLDKVTKHQRVVFWYTVWPWELLERNQPHRVKLLQSHWYCIEWTSINRN